MIGFTETFLGSTGVGIMEFCRFLDITTLENQNRLEEVMD